ncbi:hypothetical protein D3Z51_11640 [Clostridiaceae bacterium]|nr:hypothetical protein [Clostridiaceae bacterium]RKI12831.1 hypothetical protein D7V81_11400 [bacterium 1XD21-70]
MNAEMRSRQISNAYYNIGLAKAKERDLTGAADALKKSLRFHKYQTDARNLLGLIYHEIGEVGAALAQWIISLNFQQADNLAEEYLNALQDAPGYLDMADQAAKKYNQSLNYARNDNEDLAILLLMRMVEEMPNFVKAQQLLALLYIHHEDYTKAGRCLFQALKVDHYNPMAQRYMAIAKQNTGRAEVEKRKLKNAFSHRQMQDDDIILPPSYKENTGLQSVLNILAGLVLGVVAMFFLVTPTIRDSISSKYTEEVRRGLELVNQKSLEIDSLNRQLEEASSAKQEAESSLAAMVSNSGGVLSQYQRLVQILDAYRAQDMPTAVKLYVETDFSVLNDGVLDSTVSWVQQDMAQNGYQVLEQLGDAAVTRGNAAEAVDYFQKSLQIKGDNIGVIYKIGLAYKSAGDTEAANEYFGEIIMNHPNSEFAAQAKEQRGF